MKRLRLALSVLFLTISVSGLMAQRSISNVTDFIKLGIHFSPLMGSNRGIASGMGIELPLSNRWMYGADVGYKYSTFLDGDLIKAKGVQLSPFIQYYVMPRRGVTGLFLGLKPQIHLYSAHKTDWVLITNPGETGSFSYIKLTDIDASFNQYGGALTFGLRLYSMKSNLCFKASFDAGAIYTVMEGYTEPSVVRRPFSFLFVTPFLRQFNGWGFYNGITLSLGWVIRGAQPEYSL